jgi:Zn-dependent M28 family amino/carboxypeptidase
VRIEERQTAAGRARARAYLRAQWEAVGLRVSEQPYGTGVNLVGERDGTDDRRLLIGAHYDTVRSVPGADDDGSGVIAGLAVARALRGCTLAHGLRLVAFDEEELGTRGSRQSAMALSSAEVGRLIGLIQLEMLAYDSDGDGRFNVIDCAVARDRPLVEALGDPGRLGLVPVSFCTSRSDHQPFLDRGVAAIVLSQHFFDGNGKPDPNPCYHKACDTLDRITVPFFAKMTTLAAEAAARLLGAH